MNILEVIKKVENVNDGFKPMQAVTEDILNNTSTEEGLRLAHELYKSDIYQARMLAVLIFEEKVSQSPETLKFLRATVSKDENWKVQEMLARAFDRYCRDIGYEKALPVIRDWLKDKNHNVRRAVSEGLRIWTGRDYFKTHPEVAINLLSHLKDDEHEYVRKSAGNALRDISRFHKELIKKELAIWDISNKNIAYTYKLASKFI